MIDRKIVIGAAIATGAVLLVPGVAAALARAARPLVKAAAKAGATAYEEFKHAGAETFEHVEDIFAEIRSEMTEPDGPTAKQSAADVERAAKEAEAVAKAG